MPGTLLSYARGKLVLPRGELFANVGRRCGTLITGIFTCWWTSERCGKRKGGGGEEKLQVRVEQQVCHGAAQLCEVAGGFIQLVSGKVIHDSFRHVCEV